MSNNIVSFVVIGCLLFTAFLVVFTFINKRAEKMAALDTPSRVESWMRAQGYFPDHFSFFYSTAIAFKNGENRVVLYRNGKSEFCPLAEIASFKTHESIERSRPLGAAPGVVELNSTRRFNLDLTLKNTNTPLRILLENKFLMSEWETRLNTLLNRAQ